MYLCCLLDSSFGAFLPRDGGVAKERRRRGMRLGAVYRRGQLWSIAWVANGVKRYRHGFPGEDTARRVLAVRIGDLAAGRGGLTISQPAGPPRRKDRDAAWKGLR